MCIFSWLKNIKMFRLAVTVMFVAASVQGSKAFALDEKIVTNHNIVHATDDVEVNDGEKSLQINSKGTTFKVSDEKTKWVPKTEQYPDGALQRAFQEEARELEMAEEKERRLLKERDDYERRKVEAEHEIAAKKQRIEGYKIKQEQAQQEIDMMKTELTELEGQQQEIEKEVGLIDQKTRTVFAQSEERKMDLSKTKQAYSDSLDKLKLAREKANLNINRMQIEMERMRGEVAVSESDIARAENDRARAQADEVKVRTDWANLQTRTSQVKSDKRNALEELEDVRKRVAVAREDFRRAKVEFDIAEKERQLVDAKLSKEKAEMLVEMKRIENSIAQAKSMKFSADAEKARIEAENRKLKGDLSIAKQNSLQTESDLIASQGLVMESRLAIENTKADLTREIAGTEANRLRDDTRAVKIRALASMAENSDMLEAHRPFMVTKNCQVRRQPSSSGEEVGSFASGRKVIAAPSVEGFLKILNGSGKPAYIHSSCGTYVDSAN